MWRRVGKGGGVSLGSFEVLVPSRARRILRISIRTSFDYRTDIAYRALSGLSGVSTGPIRGVGCTGVWGVMWYDVEVPRGVGYPALGQAPYVALVVPAYGELCDMTWETLPKFRQKVPVFSEWARHRGDVRNSKGFVSDYGKIRGGSLQLVSEL
ncbi:hypothetical protein L3X38_012429 [Prunus dulcis]|uniref:Uncharacterized protein n=1 Tax=Prunus dulcis TaxID=3755 RepID=A0AAD4WM27_PRUDU|nr:hypothetical protein L3X38_012429 [Prunus dulcis]